jgi:hypothetical protein
VLVNSEEALPGDFVIRAKVRAGSELDGRWFSNFNWIRPHREPFASVAFGRILGFESEHVVARYVLQGINPEQFDDVLSGITYGWLNANSALAVQANAGRGKLLVTTFRFHSYGVDPFATHLLDSFVRYIASPECQPRIEVPLLTSV